MRPEVWTVQRTGKYLRARWKFIAVCSVQTVWVVKKTRKSRRQENKMREVELKGGREPAKWSQPARMTPCTMTGHDRGRPFTLVRSQRYDSWTTASEGKRTPTTWANSSTDGPLKHDVLVNLSKEAEKKTGNMTEKDSCPSPGAHVVPVFDSRMRVQREENALICSSVRKTGRIAVELLVSFVLAFLTVGASSKFVYVGSLSAAGANSLSNQSNPCGETKEKACATLAEALKQVQVSTADSADVTLLANANSSCQIEVGELLPLVYRHHVTIALGAAKDSGCRKAVLVRTSPVTLNMTNCLSVKLRNLFFEPTPRADGKEPPPALLLQSSANLLLESLTFEAAEVLIKNCSSVTMRNFVFKDAAALQQDLSAPPIAMRIATSSNIDLSHFEFEGNTLRVKSCTSISLNSVNFRLSNRPSMKKAPTALAVKDSRQVSITECDFESSFTCPALKMNDTTFALVLRCNFSDPRPVRQIFEYTQQADIQRRPVLGIYFTTTSPMGNPNKAKPSRASEKRSQTVWTKKLGRVLRFFDSSTFSSYEANKTRHPDVAVVGCSFRQLGPDFSSISLFDLNSERSGGLAAQVKFTNSAKAWSVYMEDVTVTNNTSPLDSPLHIGFFDQSSENSVVVSHAQIRENRGLFGGGLFVRFKNSSKKGTLNSVRVLDSTFERNEARQEGGAVFVHFASPRPTSQLDNCVCFERCVFKENNVGVLGLANFRQPGGAVMSLGKERVDVHTGTNFLCMPGSKKMWKIAHAQCLDPMEFHHCVVDGNTGFGAYYTRNVATAFYGNKWVKRRFGCFENENELQSCSFGS